MTIPNAFKHIKSDRPRMVTDYVITPIRRFQCLPTKPVHGLYKVCTDIAYQFTARASNVTGPLFTFYTGHAVGNELLDLLGADLPPLETWEAGIGGTNGGGGGGGGAALVVDPFNAQLLRLLNLFFLRHEFDPTKPSGQMFATVNQNLGVPQHQYALAMNTVLNRHGATSTDLVTWLISQVGGASVRPYDFTMLHDHLVALASPPSVIAIGSPY